MDSAEQALRRNEADRSLQYSDQAFSLAVEQDDSLMMVRSLIRQADAWFMRAEYSDVLRTLLKALRISQTIDDREGMATLYNYMGSAHYYVENFQRAKDYYVRSYRLFTELGNAEEVAKLNSNLAISFEELGELDSAMAYHRRDLAYRLGKDQLGWLARAYAHVGMCFDKMGETDSALYYLRRSYRLLPKTTAGVSSRVEVVTGYSRALLRSGQPKEALERCREAAALDDVESHPVAVQDCHRCFYEVYEAMGKHRSALNHFVRYTTIRDSLRNERRDNKLMRLELSYDFERTRVADSLKRADEEHKAALAYGYGLARERDQKRLWTIVAALVIVLAYGLWRRLRFVQRSRKLIRRERDRSDGLLLNILPSSIAHELKVKGEVQVQEVAGVSILFTDFNRFTLLTEQMGAQELVAEIDTCYRAFDQIVERYGLEKIKTIGDSYMCAGGLPEPREGSARNTVLAGLAMQGWLERRAAERGKRSLPVFRMRLGIHTGQVVAGVVGKSKFQYDVWGDTVNTAARMETAGTVGEVNISAVTYALIANDPRFTFEQRGTVMTKGKGGLAMWFVREADSAEAASDSRVAAG